MPMLYHIIATMANDKAREAVSKGYIVLKHPAIAKTR
jgi:hypothetical protein